MFVVETYRWWLWLLLWIQNPRVYSPVVRAADCRSAGLWFNSGWRSWFIFMTGSDNLINYPAQMFNNMSPIRTVITTITRNSVNIFPFFSPFFFPFFLFFPLFFPFFSFFPLFIFFSSFFSFFSFFFFFFFSFFSFFSLFSPFHLVPCSLFLVPCSWFLFPLSPLSFLLSQAVFNQTFCLRCIGSALFD